MNEHLRVNISIVLWLTILLVVIVYGVYLFSNIGSEDAAAEQSEEPVMLPFDVVATDAMQVEGIKGMAVAYVAEGGEIATYGYGSLADNATLQLGELSPALLSLAAMHGVEQGRITLDEAAEMVNHNIGGLLPIGEDVLDAIGMESTTIERDGVTTTIDDIAQFTATFVCDGVVDDCAIVSRYGVDTLLTPMFGWNRLSYMSLLTDTAVECCGDNWAIIVDREADVAVVVVVDSQAPVDKALFDAIRAKCSSVARTITPAE